MVPAPAGAEGWGDGAEVDRGRSAEDFLFSAPADPTAAEGLQLTPSIFAFWSLCAPFVGDFFAEFELDFFCVGED
jgi:hypothetical protein